MGAPPASASLSCTDLTVCYGQTRAVDGVSLEVQPGEIVAVLGPSGSGKTTLLHAAAGFITPAAGSIRIAGKEVSGPGWATPPERRSVGLVFQSYALWPHMTALDTVAYPYRRRGVGRKAARASAQELLERVGLGPLAQRRPHQLSGGEQQRVGLARALAASPALFLLDEPTANLDATIKPLLQQEIVRHQRATQAGALYVTHDPAEAFAVAQRVAVLRAGRLLQLAGPVTIYSQPASSWVAALTGPTSVLPAGAWQPADGGVRLTLGGQSICCAAVINCRPDHQALVVTRPEWCELAAPGALPLSGRIDLLRYQGAATDYIVMGDAGQALVRAEGPPAFTPGAPVSWAPRQVVLVEE